MTRNLLKYLATILAVIAFVSLACDANAQAQSGQENAALQGLCSGMLEQGAASVSGNHTQLCNCLVRETSARLSVEEMKAYAEANLTSREPPKSVMEKIMAIATSCLQSAR